MGEKVVFISYGQHKYNTVKEFPQYEDDPVLHYTKHNLVVKDGLVMEDMFGKLWIFYVEKGWELK